MDWKTVIQVDDWFQGAWLDLRSIIDHRISSQLFFHFPEKTPATEVRMGNERIFTLTLPPKALFTFLQPMPPFKNKVYCSIGLVWSL
jgi:hypothetical protein